MASLKGNDILNSIKNELKNIFPLKEYNENITPIEIVDKFNQNIKHEINDIILNEINFIKDLNKIGLINDTNLIKKIFKKNKLYDLYYIINGIFTYNINHYINIKRLQKGSIIFILKGGNIINSLIKTKLDYTINFDYSDLDFEIIISDELSNKDDIIKDMKKLTYILLKKIREIIFKYELTVNLQNIEKEVNLIFDFIFDDKSKISNLSRNKSNDIIEIKENPRDKFKNFQIKSSKSSNLPIYINEFFNSESLKLSIDCKYQNNEGKIHDLTILGDFIDIVISTGDVKTNIKDYKLFNIKQLDNTYNIEFKSYNFDYFIENLIKTIMTPTLPWKHHKYNKRLDRLILLLLIDMKSTQNNINIEPFIEMIESIKSSVNKKDTHNKPKPVDGKEIIKIIDENKDNSKLYTYFRNQNMQILANINLFNPADGTVTVIENTNYENFLDEFIICLQTFQENVKVELINTDELYFKKYMKYKNKYLKLKLKLL